MFTCIALWNWWCFNYTNCDIYKLHIAYRKIYKYIFKMSLRAGISDLLNTFNITPIVELIENETRNCMTFR